MSRQHFRKTLLAAALIAIGGALALPFTSQAAGTSGKSAAPMTGPANTTPEHAQGTMAKSALSSSDRKFIETAARGDIAEVQMGKLATQKAASTDVKQFGQRMVDDHSKAEDKLKQLASEKGVTLPTKMGASSEREYDKLQKLSGAGFDREYMRAMVSDHQQDIKTFRQEERSAKDTTVKTFAQSTLPTLEDHLKLAKTDQTAVNSERRVAPKS